MCHSIYSSNSKITQNAAMARTLRAATNADATREIVDDPDETAWRRDPAPAAPVAELAQPYSAKLPIIVPAAGSTQLVVL